MTSTVYNAVSEGTHFLETIETPKHGKLLPKDVNSSTPPSITEKSRASRLASRRTNESINEPRKDFMYSRSPNENTQEVTVFENRIGLDNLQGIKRMPVY